MIITDVVVIMTLTSKNSTIFSVYACFIERVFVFKRMPKERQIRVRHIYKILSHGFEFIKSDVNLKMRLNVGGNAI